MSKEDLIRKLGSRKFWSLIIVFVTSTLIFTGAGAETIEKVVAMIGAFSAIAIYMLVEGNIDAHRIDKEKEE